MLICQDCGLEFTSKQDFQDHSTLHDKVNLKKICDFCGKMFLTPRSFSKHVNKYQGKKSITCEVCGEIFSEAGYLKRHIEKDHVQQS